MMKSQHLERTYALSNVILGRDEVLHLGPEQLVGSVQFVLHVTDGFEFAGQCERPRLLLPSLSLRAVTLLCIPSRDRLLLRQHLHTHTHGYVKPPNGSLKMTKTASQTNKCKLCIAYTFALCHICVLNFLKSYRGSVPIVVIYLWSNFMMINMIQKVQRFSSLCVHSCENRV